MMCGEGSGQCGGDGGGGVVGGGCGQENTYQNQ